MILVLRRLKQDDLVLKACLGCIAKHCLKKRKKERKEKKQMMPSKKSNET
jgi:hypothetical protein